MAAVVIIANCLCQSYRLGFSGARLDEPDGDLESQPAWAVIAAETGANPDIMAISAADRG